MSNAYPSPPPPSQDSLEELVRNLIKKVDYLTQLVENRLSISPPPPPPPQPKPKPHRKPSPKPNPKPKPKPNPTPQPNPLLQVYLNLPSSLTSECIEAALGTIQGYKSISVCKENKGAIVNTYVTAYIALFDVQSGPQFFQTYPTITIEGVSYQMHPTYIRPHRIFILGVPESVSQESIETALRQLNGFIAVRRRTINLQTCEAAFVLEDSPTFYAAHPSIIIDGIECKIYPDHLHLLHVYILTDPSTVSYESVAAALRPIEGFASLQHHTGVYLAKFAVQDGPAFFAAHPSITIGGVAYSTSPQPPSPPPPPPPQPAPVTALYDFFVEPNDPHNRVPLKQGEAVTVSQPDAGSGYTFITKADGMAGYVPTSYLNIPPQ